MNIGIIGAGNMGGAIARGLAVRPDIATTLIVSSPNRRGELDALRAEFPTLSTSTANRRVAEQAQCLILAVKPWQLDGVLHEIAPFLREGYHILVSVVAGVTISHIAEAVNDAATVVRAIPNTGIAVRAGMTFVAGTDASSPAVAEGCRIFGALGKVMVVTEAQLPAATALASCGIAYALRYVRAATEGGVELGFKAADAQAIVAATLQGAAALLQAPGAHAEAEIDRVTTPGGITIKGLNAMENAGFTAAVIAGLKASV